MYPFSPPPLQDMGVSFSSERDARPHTRTASSPIASPRFDRLLGLRKMDVTQYLRPFRAKNEPKNAPFRKDVPIDGRRNGHQKDRVPEERLHARPALSPITSPRCLALSSEIRSNLLPTTRWTTNLSSKGNLPSHN